MTLKVELFSSFYFIFCICAVAQSCLDLHLIFAWMLSMFFMCLFVRPMCYFLFHSGCKLSQHQGITRPYLPDRCWHDKGQDSRGDPQDLQHKEWLHPWGRRGDSQGEPVGLWVGNEKHRRPLSIKCCNGSKYLGETCSYLWPGLKTRCGQFFWIEYSLLIPWHSSGVLCCKFRVFALIQHDLPGYYPDSVCWKDLFINYSLCKEI